MAKKGTTKPKSVRKAPHKKKTAKAAATKPAAIAHSPLPPVFTLIYETYLIIRQHAKVLFGIVAVYLVLNALFASGISNVGDAFEQIKQNLNNNTSNIHPLASAFSGFAALVGSAGASGSSSASLLQTALFIIVSLAIIWALRQLTAGKAVGVKDSYYQSMYPLIPFILVLIVILIELLPMSLGVLVINAVLTTTISNIHVVTFFSWMFFLSLAAWTFYMLSSAIFAAYIATLPNMRPREALRSANKLVAKRRMAIIPRVAFLPIFVFIVMAIVIVPLILFAPRIVAPVFYLMSSLTILFMHSYLYNLYRRLLV